MSHLIRIVVFIGLVVPAGAARAEGSTREEAFRVYAACMHERGRLHELENHASVDWENGWQIPFTVKEGDAQATAQLDCHVTEDPSFASEEDRKVFQRLLQGNECVVAGGKGAEKFGAGEGEPAECSPQEMHAADMGQPACMQKMSCLLLGAAAANPLIAGLVQRDTFSAGECGMQQIGCAGDFAKGIVQSLWETVYAFYKLPKEAIEGVHKAAEYVAKNGVEKSAAVVKEHAEKAQDHVAAFVLFTARQQGKRVDQTVDLMGLQPTINEANARLAKIKQTVIDAVNGEYLPRERDVENAIRGMETRLNEATDALGSAAVDIADSIHPWLGDLARELNNNRKAIQDALTKEVQGLRDSIWKQKQQLVAWANEKAALITKRFDESVDAARELKVVKDVEARIDRVNDMSRGLEDGRLGQLLHNPAQFLREVGPQIGEVLWHVAASQFGCGDPGIHLEGVAECKNPLPGWKCTSCEKKLEVFCSMGGYVAAEVTQAVVMAIFTAGAANAIKYGVQGAAKFAKVTKVLGEGTKAAKWAGELFSVAKKAKPIVAAARKVGQVAGKLYKVGKGVFKAAAIGMEKLDHFLKKVPVLGHFLRFQQKIDDTMLKAVFGKSSGQRVLAAIRAGDKVADEVKTLREAAKAGELLKLESPVARVEAAEKGLGRTLTPAQKKALEEAHLVGAGEIGADGKNLAGHHNYTDEQIREKVRKLKQAGFTREEREFILRKGIAGTPPRSAVFSTHGSPEKSVEFCRKNGINYRQLNENDIGNILEGRGIVNKGTDGSEEALMNTVAYAGSDKYKSSKFVCMSDVHPIHQKSKVRSDDFAVIDVDSMKKRGTYIDRDNLRARVNKQDTSRSQWVDQQFHTMAVGNVNPNEVVGLQLRGRQYSAEELKTLTTPHPTTKEKRLQKFEVSVHEGKATLFQSDAPYHSVQDIPISQLPEYSPGKTLEVFYDMGDPTQKVPGSIVWVRGH